MADTKKNTPEETPLHEIVLSVMYEINKEKPVELSATDVFYKMSDPNLNQRQINQVLDWLVNEKRLEKFSDLYSLDRFEFLDQRAKEVGPYKPKTDESGEPLPLHEIVLDAMLQAGTNTPVELTANDIFWKISDPSVREGQIVEVLNWLVTQKRVDQFAGKYAMTSLEFLDQKSAKKEEPSKNKTVEKPKKATAPKQKKAPKPQEKKPAAEKKEPVEKPKKKPAPKPKVEKEIKPAVETPKKAVPAKKTAEPKKAAVEVKPKEEKQPEVAPSNNTVQPVKGNLNIAAILTTIAAVIVVYSMYLVFSIEGKTELSGELQKVQTEMASTQKEYEELSEGNSSGENTEQKIDLMEKMLTLRSAETNVLQQTIDQSSRNNSIVLRLVVSCFLLILLTVGLLFVKTRKS